jgi:hypothetical protein
MSYYLRAFIGKPEDLKIVAETYHLSKIVDLAQGLSLIPFTEELFDQINNFETGRNIQTFEYLTTTVEDNILKIVSSKLIAYVEAEYFGGEGGQVGIIWTGGRRMAQFKYGQDVINAVLKHFGVIAEKDKDEFDTLGFRRHRDTADWMD